MRPHIRNSLSIVGLLVISAVIWIQLKRDVEINRNTDRPQIEAVSFLGENPLIEKSVNTATLTGFSEWLSHYKAGESSAGFIREGAKLAEMRRPVILQLIRADSAAALEAAIGYADYTSLPREIQSLVEQPFTTTGDVLVTAICDHDDHTPEHHVDVYLEDRTRLRIEDEYAPRTGLSKLDVPLQGIKMDGWAALDARVFETVEGDDAEWALEHLLAGNPDPSVDFLSGEALSENPITAVAGGFYFQFSSEETLSQLEAVLREFDNLPGENTGSAVIFSEEAQEIQGKGFPLEQIRQSQIQISINETTGDKTTIFIRVVFSDKPDAPISKADLETQINTEVSGHLRNFSYNQTSMTATATEATYLMSKDSAQYTFNGANGTVGTQGTIDEAISLYEAAGSPEGALSNFDIVGVIFPKLESWGSGAGLGTVGGANSRHWLNGTPSTETILHEFGHNYGLNHSNYWVFDATNAASTNPVDPSGANEEYGDLWDVMGDGDANRGHFHMAAKRYLSWLGSDQIDKIQSDGSYMKRIYRFDHIDANAGLQGLEIKKSDTENYWVGFRRGFESNANYYRGAYILWERPPNGTDRNQGWIIDTTPESDSERQDAGIGLGRTYSDPVAGVHVTAVAVGGTSPDEYLDVVVNVGAFAGNNAPTVSLSAPSTGDARTPIALSASGDDLDGDDLVYAWDLGNGDVYSSSSAINATFTVGGTYSVTVTVSDMKGGTMTQSAQITIDDPVNTWTTRSSNTGSNLLSLASNVSHVVAGGRGVILRSADGTTWEDVSPTGLGFLGNMIIEGICWTGSEFIAAGAEFASGVGQYTLLSSPDGASWSRELIEPVASSPGFPVGFKDVASNADGSKVIAVGADGGVFIRIDDGDWTQVDIGLVADDTLGGIAYGNGVFVVGGRNNGAGQELLLFRTTDGINWEDLKDNSDLMPWWGLDAVDFYNGFFVGSGFFSRTAFSEIGGLSWQSLEQGNTNQVESFAFGGGVYYAIGKDLDNGSALINLVSSNGKIWRSVGGGLVQAGNDVHYFNSSFIIVGDGGSIRQSGLVEAADEVLAGFDAWIDQYFQGDDADASENPDGDWAKNLLEWAVGSLPNSGDSAPAPPELAFDQAGKAIITISRFEKSDDVTFTVEQSSNMKDWEPLSMTVTTDSETSLVLVSDSVIESYPFFARVKAED